MNVNVQYKYIYGFELVHDKRFCSTRYAVYELSQSCFDTRKNDLPKTFDGTTVIILIFIKDKLIGNVMLENYLGATGKSIYITNASVDICYRNQKFLSTLFKTLLEPAFYKAGISASFLNVDPKNPTAYLVWQSLGYLSNDTENCEFHKLYNNKLVDNNIENSIIEMTTNTSVFLSDIIETLFSNDLPPRSTVHDYLDLWSYDGTLRNVPVAVEIGRQASIASGD